MAPHVCRRRERLGSNDKAVIGGVLKVQTHINDVMGLHVRGTYGVHKHELPGERSTEGDAAAGLGWISTTPSMTSPLV